MILKAKMQDFACMFDLYFAFLLQSVFPVLVMFLVLASGYVETFSMVKQKSCPIVTLMNYVVSTFESRQIKTRNIMYPPEVGFILSSHFEICRFLYSTNMGRVDHRINRSITYHGPQNRPPAAISTGTTAI